MNLPIPRMSGLLFVVLFGISVLIPFPDAAAQSTAAAQGTGRVEKADDLTNAQLTRICRSLLANAVLQCNSYINGALAMMRHMNTVAKTGGAICPPKAKKGRYRQLFIDWAKKNPGQAKHPASQGLIMAVQAAKLCRGALQ